MDDHRRTAFNAAAPDGERQDALSQLQREHMPGASDLMPARDILAFAEHVRRATEDQVMAKAAQVVGDPWRKPRPEGMQSAWLDPWQQTRGRWIEPPTFLTYDAMRLMVRKTPVLAAAILTRVRQIRRFCVPQAESGPGYRVRLRDRSKKLDKQEQESIKLLEQYLDNGGWEFNPLKRDALRRDGFGDLVAKLAEDSLVLDSAGIELEHRRDGRGIAGFYVVDGATLRLTAEDADDDPDVFAYQVIAGSERTRYTREDLILRPRNPSSSIYRAGYGQSEVDLMIQVVTGLLSAMDYNLAGFNRNEIPPGLLHLSGNYDQADIDSFKSYLRNMMLGANQRWKLPLMISKDQESRASFEKFGVEFNEMAFSKWMSFLVSILCALLGMSPEEINTEGFSGNSASSLSGSDTAEKLASSRDKGLRPNLAYFEQLFSQYLIQPLSDKYVFEWTGLEEEDPQAKLELNKLAWTWDELREAQGLKPSESDLGPAPLNPSLIGPWLQMQQQGQPEDAPQEDFGTPPGGDGQEEGQAADQEQPPAQPKQDFGAAPTPTQGGDFGKSLGFAPQPSLRIYALAD